MLLLACGPLAAQFSSDTTLHFPEFLRQCQEFSRQPQEEVWVVHFWASSNSASLYTLSALKAVQLEFASRPVRFVGVGVDKSRPVWEARLIELGLPWEQLWLPREADYEFLRRAFKHNSLPALFLVHTDGQIQRLADPAELRSELLYVVQTLPGRPRTAPRDPSGWENPVPVPAEPAPQTSPSYPGWQTHTVQPGETLFSLYRRYGVKVDQLKAANGLKSDALKPGQVLKIKRLQ